MRFSPALATLAVAATAVVARPTNITTTDITAHNNMTQSMSFLKRDEGDSTCSIRCDDWYKFFFTEYRFEMMNCEQSAWARRLENTIRGHTSGAWGCAATNWRVETTDDPKHWWVHFNCEIGVSDEMHDTLQELTGGNAHR